MSKATFTLNTSNQNYSGFVKIPRVILQTAYLSDPKLLRAWVVICTSKRYMPTVVDNIPLEAEDVLFTKNELSQLFGLNKRTVRDVLNRMQDDGFIRWMNIRNKYTLISVIDPMMTSLSNSENIESMDDLQLFREDVHNRRNNITKNKRTENTTDSKICDSVTENNQETATEKKAYGIFRNVYLSDDELSELDLRLGIRRDNYIDRLSSYLKNEPERYYENHFAVIYSWYLRDESNTKREPDKKEKREITPDPTASYDILEAQRRAETSVPKLRKRQRR